MITEQKELLAQIVAAEKSALALYKAGIKVGGVIQKIRGVRKELETRVRYLEANAAPAKKSKKAAEDSSVKNPAQPQSAETGENKK